MSVLTTMLTVNKLAPTLLALTIAPAIKDLLCLQICIIAQV